MSGEMRGGMRITAKADYAVRAVLELASSEGRMRTARELADAQGISQNFLENILSELRRAGLVRTLRGPSGGSMLTRPVANITVADILRAVDAPLATVRDLPPEFLEYPGAAAALPGLWLEVGRNFEATLSAITIGDLVQRPAVPRTA